jgi:glucosamine-6-phosphate deaminase
MQQVGEGWFADLDACPTHAASLSIPAIMACKSISCVVPDERKREAVGKSIRDAVDTACPATILRTHADCALWLDQNSSPFA